MKKLEDEILNAFFGYFPELEDRRSFAEAIVVQLPKELDIETIGRLRMAIRRIDRLLADEQARSSENL